MNLRIEHKRDRFIELDFDEEAGLEVTVSDFSGSLENPHNQAVIWLEPDEIALLKDFINSLE